MAKIEIKTHIWETKEKLEDGMMIWAGLTMALNVVIIFSLLFNKETTIYIAAGLAIALSVIIERSHNKWKKENENTKTENQNGN